MGMVGVPRTRVLPMGMLQVNLVGVCRLRSLRAHPSSRRRLRPSCPRRLLCRRYLRSGRWCRPIQSGLSRPRPPSHQHHHLNQPSRTSQPSRAKRAKRFSRVSQAGRVNRFSLVGRFRRASLVGGANRVSGFRGVCGGCRVGVVLGVRWGGTMGCEVFLGLGEFLIL